MRKILHRPGLVKRTLYKRGHRPEPGSILYSPSLATQYAMLDARRRNIRTEADVRAGARPLGWTFRPGRYNK